MSDFKVTEIFIGAGAALDVATTVLPSMTKQLGIVGPDMIVPSLSVSTISLAPELFIVNKLANGDFKRSNPIKGTSVTGYKGEAYVPSRRAVWSVGFHRPYTANTEVAGASRTFTAAGGSIVVANSALYELTIKFKNDKSFYSQRPEVLSVSFTSSATATQLSIATQIAAAINNSKFGSAISGVKELIAVVIGDGTGLGNYGLTGATNYGVEITGLSINQFQNTQYAEELVSFSVHVDDSTAFAGTASNEIQTVKQGTGTYNQVYNLENKLMGFLDKTSWTRPTPVFLSSATLTPSATVVASASQPVGPIVAASNTANTIGNDVVEVTTATSGLRPGESITIGGVTYEIKYIISATKFVLTTQLTAVVAGTAFLVNYGYNIIVINVEDGNQLSGSGANYSSKKNIIVATRAIDSGATDPFAVTTPGATNAGADTVNVIAALNNWMTSTPLAPANITLAKRF